MIGIDIASCSRVGSLGPAACFVSVAMLGASVLGGQLPEQGW